MPYYDAAGRVLNPAEDELDGSNFVLCREAFDAISIAAEWLEGILTEDADELDAGIPYESAGSLCTALPVCFSSRYTPDFVRRFAAVVGSVAEKLKNQQALNATIEELAAHELFAEAIEAANRYEEYRGTAARDVAIMDLHELRELIVEDDDVLMLFDLHLDGVENSELGRMVGVVNLGFDDWFVPFRDPDQGESAHAGLLAQF